MGTSHRTKWCRDLKQPDLKIWAYNVRYCRLSCLSRSDQPFKWLYRTAISLTVRKTMGIRAIKAFSSTVIKPVTYFDG
jgi:hypothetical protein